MVREEAIRHIESIKPYAGRNIKNALDMAIKALEQDSVLDKIKGYIDHIRNTGMGKKKSLEFIEKFIEGLARRHNESTGNT